MTAILAVAVAMMFGLASTRLVKLIHLPNVTGYLVAGLLIGPIFHIVNDDNLASLDIISTVALGFIAFSIGSEFKLANIKQLGGKIVIITVAQSLTAALLVGLALWAFRAPLPIVFVLAAVATATAPAATLMVVRQYKAHGPVTNTLLPVVAFDDAIGLIAFSVCFALAQTFASGVEITAYTIVVLPLCEIAFSIGIGGVLGAILALMMKFFHSRANRLCLMVCTTILGVAICEIITNNTQFSMSSLLTCMMIGATFCNLRSDSTAILDGCERWTPPLFMLFFVLSGAELKLNVVTTVGIIGVVYIVARSTGKYFGTFFSAMATKSEKNVKNYLGITLLPQAGVAIGMAQIASTALGEYGAKVMAVVLSATLFYEIVGPILTKLALKKAGEIEEEPRRIRRRDKNKAVTAA